MSTKFKDASSPHPQLEKEAIGNAIKNTRMYEILTFNEGIIPELDKWDVGQDYVLTIKARLKRHVKDDKKKVFADFEVLAVKAGEQEEDNLTNEQKRVKDLLG